MIVSRSDMLFGRPIPLSQGLGQDFFDTLLKLIELFGVQSVAIQQV